jgi:hypothetical protein
MLIKMKLNLKIKILADLCLSKAVINVISKSYFSFLSMIYMTCEGFFSTLK